MTRLLATLPLLALLAGPAVAADLVIGARATPAVDPHFQWLSTNTAYSLHMFDALVRNDADGKLQPALAESWRQLDNLTWEMKLRRGVRFHDGSEFTAKDVIFSVDRIATLPNNPNPYTNNIRSITKLDEIDPWTLRITTRAPDPLVIGPLASVIIVSHKAAAGAMPADFRSGKAAIGTGPYKFAAYVNDERLDLVRNDGYWGGRPTWDKVSFRIISKDSSRVAALLAGDVDVIDFVPTTEIPTLEKSPRTAVFSGPSDRLMFLMLDVGRSPTPYAVGADGKPLDPNPMRDIRVRRAMAMAVDRDAILKRVMEGAAGPTWQMVPEGVIGFDPTIAKPPADPAGARRLLAEAGYPNGFGLTVHCSNNRYVNDGQLCQAIGQMMARIGIKTEVVAMPLNVFFPRITAPKSEFSLILFGWGNSATAADFLTAILHTYDRDKRRGHANRAYFSDPAYDQMVEDAVTEMDATVREQKMRKAVRYITEQYATIPLHVQFTVLAARKGLVVSPRRDEMTLAEEVKPAN